jgi:hypothetical protein
MERAGGRAAGGGACALGWVRNTETARTGQDRTGQDRRFGLGSNEHLTLARTEQAHIHAHTNSTRAATDPFGAELVLSQSSVAQARYVFKSAPVESEGDTN